MSLHHPHLDADDVMTSIGGAFGHRAFNGANTLATNTTDEVVSYDVYLSTDDLFTDVTAITVQTNSYTPAYSCLFELLLPSHP